MGGTGKREGCLRSLQLVWGVAVGGAGGWQGARDVASGAQTPLGKP